jgi:UDP-glucose 4-epimerase
MKILVTGGAGYIGSHTCVALLQSGYEVVVLDSLVNAKPEALEAVRQITDRPFSFHQVDLLDAPAVERVFAAEQPDAVIHFAAQGGGESVRKPLEYYHNNLTGTLVLCDAMRRHGCFSLVFSSSATVYGAGSEPPFSEDAPLSAAPNPYGSTKLMIETILRDLHTADRAGALRCCATLIPSARTKAG